MDTADSSNNNWNDVLEEHVVIILEAVKIVPKIEIEIKAVAASLGTHLQLEDNNNDASLDKRVEINSKHGSWPLDESTSSGEDISDYIMPCQSSSVKLCLMSFNHLKERKFNQSILLLRNLIRKQCQI